MDYNNKQSESSRMGINVNEIALKIDLELMLKLGEIFQILILGTVVR